MSLCRQKLRLASSSEASKVVRNENMNANELALYTVLLQEPALSSYDGSVAGLAATSPSFTGEAKLNPKSPESLAYRSYLADRQQRFIKQLESEFQRAIEIKFTYQVALNGFAAVLTPAEAAVIARQRDVRLVERSGLNQIDTDAGPGWIGAPGIWDGSNTGALPGTKGEGIIVGILDTGINSNHPSFAATGPYDGYVHTLPPSLDSYLGVCDPDNPSIDFICNDKLIGGWDFVYDIKGVDDIDYPTPEDEDGHGSHTASTTAGNVVDATLVAPTTSINHIISGVAPHANIIAYDVCHSGGCPYVSTTAAVEQAILDGVDVINYSISGGEDPYHETTDLAFLEAYNAGVFVSTSAGNLGGTATVAHRGPWVSASAAATHNRSLSNSLVDMSGDGTPPANIPGVGFTNAYGPASIVYAADYGDPFCPSGAFPAGTFNGEIVVCDRGGDIARVEKAQSVLDGGAGGFVLANDIDNGDSLSGDAYVIPGVHITYNDGVLLKAWIADGTTHTASISGWTESTETANGDILAAFSSRGPNTTFDVLKPDLTTPGVDIWAAVHTPDLANPGVDEYGFLSGTSMAAPHTAGAAALISALYPDWSSAELLSALMMTADRSVLLEDGINDAGWFDMGAGRVDLNAAAKTGLVLDETYTNFVAANPAEDGDVKTLNLPSLTNSQCIQSCDWSRTFTSVAGAEIEWTITSSGDVPVSPTPSSFTIDAGDSQQVVFSADAAGLDYGKWYFGMITLTPSDVTLPALHIPVSIIPSVSEIPSLVTVTTRRDAGSQIITGLETIAASELTIQPFGLIRGELTFAFTPQDPTTGDPFDDPTDGTFFVLVDVPADAARIVTEIIETTATNLDLFVGLDGGDGVPEAAELVCSSAATTVLERCNLMAPAEGSYWILVQNLDASAEGAMDSITLSLGVVPGTSAGNMTVVGPVSVEPAVPYDLILTYDISVSQPGAHWYGAFSLGSSATTAGDIGLIPVDIIRISNDVVKSGPSFASQGNTIAYEISVEPNLTPVDLTYTITDTIPSGLTLDPLSVKVSAGSFNVVGDTIVWTLPNPVLAMFEPYLSYAITTSENDPLCDTGFAGYVDLETRGLKTVSTISGDMVGYNVTISKPIDYFGQSYPSISFTDDGFALFDFSNNYAGQPYIAQTVPDAAFPNNLLAMLWQDMEIVYNLAENRGVTAGTDYLGSFLIIEYDDIQLWEDPTNQYDFEIVVYPTPSDAAGDYEYIFAYDNLEGDLMGALTIGFENVGGAIGAALVNKGDASSVISNGFMVCLNQIIVDGKETMTYNVTVDSDAVYPITNSAVSITDNPGSVPVSTSHDLFDLLDVFLPITLKQ